LRAIAGKDPRTELRALAVRALVARGENAARLFKDKQAPAVRLEAVAALNTTADLPRLLDLLTGPDAFLHHAAVERLARFPDLARAVPLHSLKDARQRLGLLLAHRASGRPEAVRLVGEFLADPDEQVRFLAAKWVADQKLAAYRPQIVRALKDKNLNVRMYTAYSTALARIDNREVNEAKMADYFFERLRDEHSPRAIRVMALQLIPPSHPQLTVDLLARLLHQNDPALRLEAARALSDHPSPKRPAVLRAAAHDRRLGNAVRAQAILGLAGQAPKLLDDLLAFALGENAVLRDEALRALIGTKLTGAQRGKIKALAVHRPETAALVARVLGKPFTEGRPPARDLDAWLKRLAGHADPATGRRIFFHPKLAGCFRCHRVEGRGNVVGPDLGTIGRAGRRQNLESILVPSALIAPHYQTWQIETVDGKTYTGLLVGTYLDEYSYLDPKGNVFKLNTRNIVDSRPLSTSLMPDDLAGLMTDRELRDVLAYLDSRR
jgi:putative heme-binding domain-containing protein